MTLVKIESDRVNELGQPYDNLLLCWRFDGKICYTKIKCVFPSEFRALKAQAIRVPKGEPLAKYVS